MFCEYYCKKLSEKVKEIKIAMDVTFQHQLTPSVLSYGFCHIVFSLTFKLLNTTHTPCAISLDCVLDQKSFEKV